MPRAKAHKPLVSVIIPTYRRPACLAQALESVFAQTYRPLDVIVVDDASGDGCVAQYSLPEGVRLLRHSVNQGPSAARNTGLAAARGDLIAWLDCDDVWLPGKIASQVQILQSEPTAGMTYCHATMVGPSLEPLPAQLEPVRVHGDPLPVIAWRNFIRSPSCVLARRSVVEQAGGYDTTMIGAEDWDLWISMARFAGLTGDERAWVLYRNHAGQRSESQRQRVFSDEQVRTKWLAWARREAPQYHAVMRKALCRDLQRHATQFLWEGRDARHAFHRMFWAIGTYPRDIRCYTRLARLLSAFLNPRFYTYRGLW